MASAIARTVARFANSFDRKDWAALEALLADEVELDYADLRGQVETVPRATYVRQRREALEGLATQHLLANLEIHVEGSVARCLASGVIQRRAGEKRFDSHVLYAFGLRVVGGEWRIASIQQRVLWNEGDPSIHRGAAARRS